MQEAATMSDALTDPPARTDLARRLLEDFLSPATEARQDVLDLSPRHHEILRTLKAHLKSGLTTKDLTAATTSKGHPHGEAVVAALCQRLLDEELVRVVKSTGLRRYYLTSKGSLHLATLGRAGGRSSPRPHSRRARITETLRIGTDALRESIAKTLAANSPELLGPAEIAEKMGLDRSEGTGTIRTLLQELVTDGRAVWIELRPGCGVYKASADLVSASGGETPALVSAVAASVLGFLAGSTRPVEVAAIARELGLPKTALRLPMFELKHGGYALRKRRRGVVSYMATEAGREIVSG